MISHAGSVVDATKWFYRFGFDSMGAIAFGESFDTIDSEKNRWVFDVLMSGTVPFAVFGPIPWAFIILGRLPGSPFLKFVNWCTALVDERRKSYAEDDVPDVMSNLIEDYNKSEDKANSLTLLGGDSRLIVLAGAYVLKVKLLLRPKAYKSSRETTAGTLSNLFYFLAADPSKQTRLRTELSKLPKSEAEVDFKALQEAPLLNGVINETLRLWPPVLGGLLYLTPPEGITIGKTFIPGNVTVYSPTYTVQRCKYLLECPRRP